MKHYAIYSKRLRNHLIDSGFHESKTPEPNIRNPEYLVFFFEDTDDLRNELWRYMDGIL